MGISGESRGAVGAPDISLRFIFDDLCLVIANHRSVHLVGMDCLYASLSGVSLKEQQSAPQQSNPPVVGQLPQIVITNGPPLPDSGQANGYFSDANWTNYWSNVAQYFEQTNGMKPPGTGIITAGGVSDAMWGTGAFTAGRYIFSGLRGATMGSATFSSLETGLIVGYTAVVNFAVAGSSFEVGAGAGSMISAIPASNGNTIASLLGLLLYNMFGPSSPYNGASSYRRQ